MPDLQRAGELDGLEIRERRGIRPVKGAFKKPTRKAFPELAKVCDDYFGADYFDGIAAYAMRGDGAYVVFATPTEHGYVIADLALGGYGWEMQNDSSDYVTEADLRHLYIVPECDWFVIPGNESYKSIGDETGYKSRVATTKGSD
jgi:hypothetical protein